AAVQPPTLAPRLVDHREALLVVEHGATMRAGHAVFARGKLEPFVRAHLLARLDDIALGVALVARVPELELGHVGPELRRMSRGEHLTLGTPHHVNAAARTFPGRRDAGSPALVGVRENDAL